MVNASLSATLGGGNMKVLLLASRRLSLIVSSCHSSLLVCCFAVRKSILRIILVWRSVWLVLVHRLSRTRRLSSIQCKSRSVWDLDPTFGFVLGVWEFVQVGFGRLVVERLTFRLMDLSNWGKVRSLTTCWFKVSFDQSRRQELLAAIVDARAYRTSLL